MDAIRKRLKKVRDFLLRRAHRQAEVPVGDGVCAEQLAAEFLSKIGGRVLARNVRCRGGEVDLIVLLGNTVVFVEVRKRRRSDYGGAEGSITAAKQQRIVMASRHWLAGAGREYADRVCRFDAVLLSRLSLDSIKWVQDAFRP